MRQGRRQRERRQFSREFKLEALARFETAGNVEALAEDLGIRRELLYKWREKFAAGGAEALKTSGRPRPSGVSPESMAAKDRIAELERKLGQQAFEDYGQPSQLAGLAQPRPSPGAHSHQPAVGGGHHLCPAHRGLRLSRAG